MSDMETLVVSEGIKAIFQEGISSLKSLEKWGIYINKKYDPFGWAAARYTNNLQLNYNSMKILGMPKPVPLKGIYVNINIFEKISALQRVDIDDLENVYGKDQHGFGVRRETKRGIEVVNSYPKLIVLGKPGAGKSTFLKWIAMQCNAGNRRRAERKSTPDLYWFESMERCQYTFD